MGGSKGGQANSSGMYEALASAQAAQTAYALGEQNLQWAQQQWGQEQPMIQQIVGADIGAQQQQQQFANQQEQLYQGTYEPLQKSYTQQAEQWASPGQQAINAGAAAGNVAEASDAQRNTATQQLESFGINPGSTRFAGLDIGSRTMQAAAEAGAATAATQQTKLQGLGLESGAINTGMGLPNQSATLSGTGTGAGGAGAGASQSNIATGSGAMTAPTSYFNTGAANMGVYANAVGSYNQSQLGYAQLGAMQTAGLGSLAGGLLGGSSYGGASGLGLLSLLEDGGPAGAIPPAPSGNPGNVTATPGVTPGHVPANGTPGGAIPSQASPSGGREVDDVPARLTAGEFVIPKDVTEWEGQKYFYNQIDKSRVAREQAHQRTDIGGKSGSAIPVPPTFVSRPQAQSTPAPTTPAPVQNHARAMWSGGPTTTYGQQGAIPTERLVQRRAMG